MVISLQESTFIPNMSAKTMELKSQADRKVSTTTVNEPCSGDNIRIKELNNQREEQIEIQTKSGYKITIIKNASSAIENIVLSYNTVEGRECSIGLSQAHNSISISSQMDLHIKATNIEIEADKFMNLKSGSIMTINGAIVKIN